MYKIKKPPDIFGTLFLLLKWINNIRSEFGRKREERYDSKLSKYSESQVFIIQIWKCSIMKPFDTQWTQNVYIFGVLVVSKYIYILLQIIDAQIIWGRNPSYSGTEIHHITIRKFYENAVYKYYTWTAN